jgi:hypothetical protein
MNLLPSTTITGAIATTTTPWVPLNGTPRNLVVQANLAYGSGGTSVDVYVQTTFDGGVSATDIANFHFTTSSARKAFNVSAVTPQLTPVALTDGAISANTAQDGLIGPRIRLKYTSSGTYAGGTTLQVDAHSIDIPAYPA